MGTAIIGQIREIVQVVLATNSVIRILLGEPRICPAQRDAGVAVVPKSSPVLGSGDRGIAVNVEDAIFQELHCVTENDEYRFTFMY